MEEPEPSESESDPLGPTAAGPGGPPLDERILSAVRLSKRDADGLRRVAPARLSSELGLSVEDATRELCGLLAAVGGTAGFAFERVGMPSSGGEADLPMLCLPQACGKHLRRGAEVRAHNDDRQPQTVRA